MYINVDNGGTFTDFWAFDATHQYRVKTRTTPHDLSECLFEGLRLLSEEVYRGSPDLSRLLAQTKYIRYSTTQGTNALVQRRGPRVGLVVPEDFDVKQMQTDGEAADMLSALVGDRVARLDTGALENEGADIDPHWEDVVMRVINALTAQGANRIVISLGNAAAEKRVQRLSARKFPQHLLGTIPLLISSDVTPDRNLVRATWTAVFNAFLHPAMERFLFNTDNRLKAQKFHSPLLVFRNDGMAGRVAKTSAIKTYGSGPEGGVCGAEALAQTYGYEHLVTVDVGGTTTDFGVVEGGHALRHRYGKVETVDVSIPMSHLRSIGVGGGSIIRADKQKILVGPQSVGAAPGPACFGFGGSQATITDVKLLKGVIDPQQYFGGRMALDSARAERAVETHVAVPLNMGTVNAIDAMEVAWVEAVADHLRPYIKSGTVLGAFGGAGPFSICAIAEAVGIKKVIVPALAAVFSASGIGESDIGHRYERYIHAPTTLNELQSCVQALRTRSEQDMFAEGFSPEQTELAWRWSIEGMPQKSIEVEDLAALLTIINGGSDGTLYMAACHSVDRAKRSEVAAQAHSVATQRGTRCVRLHGGVDQTLPVYMLEDLRPGMSGVGPAIIEDAFFTLPLLDKWRFNVTRQGDIELQR